MSGFVENAPHVDERRMRNIPDDDLLRIFSAPSIPLLRKQLADRDAAPVMDTRRWARTAGAEARTAMVAKADALLDRPVDFLDRAHGRSGLYGFHYLHWAQPLTRAYAATGDQRYAARFASVVDDWYASRDHVRGEWPNLDVVWYTLGVASRSQVFAEALHVFGESMPEDSWARMLKTVVGGARWLAEEHTSFRHGNWQLAGCAVLAQLAAFLPEFAESDGWSSLAHRRLIEHLELDVYADGGHYERVPSYHTMCLGALQFAAIAGEQRLNWDLASHPRFAAMHDWLLTMTAPAGWVPPFNDSHLLHSAELLLRGHYLLDRPAYKDVVTRRLSPERITEVLSWLPPRPGRGDPVAEFEAAPSHHPRQESQWLAQSKFAVQRGGEDGLFAVVNCGPLIEHELETHSHRAVLDFVLAGYGRPLAWEAGGPDTYDDLSYQDWYRSGRAHNTVLLPGREMADLHDARVEHVRMSAVADVLVAEHDGLGVSHRRTVLFVKPGHGMPGYWVISDEVSGDEPFHWALHGLSPWQELPGVAYRSADGPGLLVLPCGPEPVSAARYGEGATSVPTATGAEPGTLYGVRLEYSAGSVSHVLVPFASEPPDLRVSAEKEIRWGRFTDTVGDGYLVRAAEGTAYAAVLWCGTGIEHSGRELMTAHTGSLHHAVLTWRDGRTVADLTCIARTAVSFAAEPEVAVRLNDVLLPLSTVDGRVHLVLPAAGQWSVEIERTI